MTSEQLDAITANLIAEHNLGAIPIDVGALAVRLGYRVAYSYFDDLELSATVIRDASNVVTLGINTLQAPTRQRFSIAHEIGHA